MNLQIPLSKFCDINTSITTFIFLFIFCVIDNFHDFLNQDQNLVNFFYAFVDINILFFAYISNIENS